MQQNTSTGPWSVPLAAKSTIEEIRARFDQDVERFSRLETGQAATLDAPLVLELVAQAAATHLRPGDTLLDLGCGAGNYTLRVLQEVRPLICHLVDLSRPMLERARERIRATGVESVTAHQTDLRELDHPDASVDCILAAAVLHHLRDEPDWLAVLFRLHRWLKPGGRLYVADLVVFDEPGSRNSCGTALAGIWYRWEGRNIATRCAPMLRRRIRRGRSRSRWIFCTRSAFPGLMCYIATA